MEKLMKLMEKKRKEGKHLDPMAAKAKMSMLEALHNEMSGLMKNDLQNHGMKKVEVASDDNEGLKQGLDKAKDLLNAKEGDDEDMEHMADGGMTGDAGSDLEPSDDHEGIEDGDDEHGVSGLGKEPGANLIADQINHESAENELSDDDIEKLEMILEKAKKSKMSKMM